MKKYYIPPVLYGASDIRIDEITSQSEHAGTGLIYIEVNGVAKFYTDESNIYDETQLKQLMIKRTSDLKRRIDQRLRLFMESVDNE